MLKPSVLHATLPLDNCSSRYYAFSQFQANASWTRRAALRPFATMPKLLLTVRYCIFCLINRALVAFKRSVAAQAIDVVVDFVDGQDGVGKKLRTYDRSSHFLAKTCCDLRISDRSQIESSMVLVDHTATCLCHVQFLGPV